MNERKKSRISNFEQFERHEIQFRNVKIEVLAWFTVHNWNFFERKKFSAKIFPVKVEPFKSKLCFGIWIFKDSDVNRSYKLLFLSLQFCFTRIRGLLHCDGKKSRQRVWKRTKPRLAGRFVYAKSSVTEPAYNFSFSAASETEHHQRVAMTTFMKKYEFVPVCH